MVVFCRRGTERVVPHLESLTTCTEFRFGHPLWEQAVSGSCVDHDEALGKNIHSNGLFLSFS
jgi:hypothetical protein